MDTHSQSEQLGWWLYDQQTDGKVVHLFKEYLLAGGTHTLTLLLKPGSKLGVEARFHNVLTGTAFWRVNYVQYRLSTEHIIFNGKTLHDWQTSGLKDSWGGSCR
jgi:hypothetical protein